MKYQGKPVMHVRIDEEGLHFSPWERIKLEAPEAGDYSAADGLAALQEDAEDLDERPNQELPKEGLGKIKK